MLIPGRIVPAPGPFFLDTPSGRRFCLLHLPVCACIGAVLYVPPFAEEMNISRRMAACQARKLAAAGYAVLQLDLYGCGDSDGDFRDATWQVWKQDVATAFDWLHRHLTDEITLWGLRLGALLLLDWAGTSQRPIRRCILWQPIIHGAPYINQILRMRLAGDMLHTNLQATSTKAIQAMRATLDAGDTIEVGGYELSSELVHGIDAVDASGLVNVPCAVDWVEILAAPGLPIPIPRKQFVEQWMAGHSNVSLHLVIAPSFWTSATSNVPESLSTAMSNALSMETA